MNASSTSATSRSASGAPARSEKSPAIVLVLSWAAVGLPLAWGVAETLRKTFALFQ